MQDDSPANVPKLTWDVVLEKFHKLIRFAARQQVDIHATESSMDVDDLYQEGLIKLYDCWQKWCVNPDNNKDMDEFAPIFKVSLFRRMRQFTSSKPIDVDLEGIAEWVGDSSVEDPVEKLYMQHGLEHLMEMLQGDTARALLQELIDPSEKTLFEVYADIKRKEMLRSQGKKVNVPKDTTVRMKHIQRALGITVKQYDIAMSEIRMCAREAMEY